jgi:hypothetical protein
MSAISRDFRPERARAVLLSVLLGLLPLAVAHSQHFGRNNVLWQTFEF